MHKTRAWQIWWENDPDAQRLRKLSASMCSHGVNIAELTREAFLAGVEMRLYIVEGQKTATNTRSAKRAKPRITRV
jgi:hypothetical protein